LWHNRYTNVPAARTAAELLSPVIWRYRAWRIASSKIGPQVKFLFLFSTSLRTTEFTTPNWISMREARSGK
jgi:hypothetical protein